METYRRHYVCPEHRAYPGRNGIYSNEMKFGRTVEGILNSVGEERLLPVVTQEKAGFICVKQLLLSCLLLSIPKLSCL